MTVSTEVSREEYTGNGVTTDFDYRFRVFSAADLVVSVADTTETISVLTLNTDYTVTGAGSRAGGKVKLFSPLAFNWRINIERALPVTQETDIRNQGNFFPEVHEDAFDKLTMLIQQVWSYFDLALRKPTWLAKYYDALGNRISNLGNPGNPQDAATKSYVDAGDAANSQHIDDLFKRTLRVPESSVSQLPAISGRANSIFGWNDQGKFVPIYSWTDTADLAMKLASNSVPGLSLVAMPYSGNLSQAIQFLTFEMFGALGDGVTADDAAITATINKAAEVGWPIYSFGIKTYRLTSSKLFEAFNITIIGAGPKKTVFLLDHYDQGLWFGPQVYSSTKYQGILKGFRVSRKNPDGYTGIIGPKNIFISNRNKLVIEDVEVDGHIGWAVTVDYSSNVIIDSCYAHDSIGGLSAQKAGTDGFHLYRCNTVWVTHCIAENMGDDGFSTGSENTSYQCYDINFINNKVLNCAGSFKFYGLVNGGTVLSNTVRTSYQGGVYLTNNNNAVNGAIVQNIHISKNKFFNVWDAATLTNVSGAIRVRFWADKSVPNATATISNISIEDNEFYGCQAMLTMEASDDIKRLNNLYIRGNNFTSPSYPAAGSRHCIRLTQCDYDLAIENNNFSGVHSSAIYIDNKYSSSTTVSRSIGAIRRINNNTIRGYNRAASIFGNTISTPAIYILESGFDLVCDIIANKADDCSLTDVANVTQSINVATVSPLSHIESNSSDLSQVYSGGSGAYKGIIKFIGGVPSVGTHYKYSRLQQVNDAGTVVAEYMIYKAGTYGTISGITADTSSGSRNITLNSTAGLYVGCVILISGIATTFTVTSIAGSVATLNSLCGVTLSAASVSFSAPQFKTLTWS